MSNAHLAHYAKTANCESFQELLELLSHCHRQISDLANSTNSQIDGSFTIRLIMLPARELP